MARRPMDFLDLGVVGEGTRPATPGPAAAIEIELPSGVRLRVGPGVTGEALRAALAAVKAEL
jgi:hypothetical protein